MNLIQRRGFKAAAMVVIALQCSVLGGWSSFTRLDINGDDAEFNDLSVEGTTLLWGATENGGVVSYDGAAWSWYYAMTGDLQDKTVKVICVTTDALGDIWMGTLMGVTIHNSDGSWNYFDSTRVVVTPPDSGSGLDTIYDTLTIPMISIAADNQNRKWVGTDGSGVRMYDNGTWTFFTVADGLIDSTIRVIACDPSGPVWFGCDNGLSRYDNGVWTSFTTDSGLCNNKVRDILVAADGIVWIATFNGISRYDPAADTWTTYNNPDSFGENIFSKIRQDRYGFLWFASYLGGVKKFDPAANRFAPTCDTTGGKLINRLVMSIAIDSNNVRWFGTVDGISRYENEAPVISQAVFVDTTDQYAEYTLSFAASDIDGDSLLYSLSAAPAGMAIDPVTGDVTWTPAVGTPGTHVYAVVADDRNGGSDTQSVSLTVLGAVMARPNTILPTVASLAVSDWGNRIAYAVPAGESRVSLTIFNSKGAVVKDIVSGKSNPGVYTVAWNDGSRNAGWYLCRLMVGSKTLTKTLIVR